MLQSLQERIHFARLLTLYREDKRTIERRQAQAFKKIIQHAMGQVSAYKKLYTKKTDSPPIIDKTFFRTYPTEAYLDSSREVRAAWVHTSGTSGAPLSLPLSDLMYNPHYVDFTCYRFVPLRQLAKMKVVIIDTHTYPRQEQLFIPLSECLADPTTALKKINTYQPELISSFASVLLELAQTIAHNPTFLSHKPTYIVSTGEVLTSNMRACIESAFGSKVYDRYGAAEVGSVAVECHMHNGMHVNVESVLVEVVDERGAQVPEGAWGRIIVTDLLNYNMPFIRYALGDRGKLTHEPCRCGLQTPRLWVEGRSTSFLIFGQRKFHQFEFDALDAYNNTILRYQFAKATPTQLEVRVLPGPGYAGSTTSEIQNTVQKIVGSGIVVQTHMVSSLPIEPSGKTRLFVDETA